VWFAVRRPGAGLAACQRQAEHARGFAADAKGQEQLVANLEDWRPRPTRTDSLRSDRRTVGCDCGTSGRYVKQGSSRATLQAKFSVMLPRGERRRRPCIRTPRPSTIKRPDPTLTLAQALVDRAAVDVTRLESCNVEGPTTSRAVHTAPRDPES